MNKPPDYWWETPIEREARLARIRTRPRLRSILPWYYRIDWVALMVWITVAIAMAAFLWQLTAPPVDPCGARCSDARP